MINIDETEKLVSQHIDNGDTNAAVKLLFKMIVQYAEEKNFIKAEQLRERMLEVDPMALDEIISSAEIIEEGKSQSLDPIHMQIWSKLYDMLDTEEKNELFYSMQDSVLGINEAVFSQGKLDTNLYFINQGQLKMVYENKAGDVLLYTLGSGQLAGQENFFSNTVCTTSLITLSNVNLKYLAKDTLLKWKTELPTLEQKLNDFCDGFPSATKLLQSKKMDRRALKRIKLSGKGLINLLNRAGEPIGKSFKGALSDISVGGLSFEIRISKEETARILLGRRISIALSVSKSIASQVIDQKGIIVGVYPFPFEDYSIHVKFDKQLDQAVINAMEP
ncbi:MAG: cyclic nucleotide-binding domain-containing protein [Deltaproteobacteria bacterium]|nr:cyclic nucleotide-binding domain-containing protein [Deltaproteobacteria bacterium]